ncbi:hypothetical protein CAPTEDRAFT_206657 [Capitella teleta]|uniref:Tesmin/TSO1-like CXC domain-containing protein n=1 Tax=Capitella teleta TaxID=283909 RepID=R7UD81_CAPTE|nr:hypothetical protein CAPTEDRAFT_206657 [Capitella teleta]|eukprot:ELU04056.1 hypothetical protein CAPTEDRAFT_206657 [Capitella teleta]
MYHMYNCNILFPRFSCPSLNCLGFSDDYKEVQRFLSAIASNDQPSYQLDGFFQFVFDNADFNVATISGHNTFHSIGGIGCVTPDSGRSRHTIKRSTKLVKADVTGEFGKVAIKAYKKPFVSALSCIKVSSLFPDELNPRSQKLLFTLDQLWMASMTLPDANLSTPSPSWGGFMQLASKGENYKRTRIEILPFINLQPTNPSSIYTALNFSRKQSSLHGMETCFVTFDQPLNAKAIKIVASDEILQGVVVRMGGFHLLMSFMCSVGYIMGGSGLEVLWESVYAPASVVHMMTGHAHTHALRAHLLTSVALFTFMMSEMEDKTKENLSALHKAIIACLYAKKPETPKAEIENAREEFLLKLYSSNKLGSTHDKLRHYKYKQAIEKSSLTSTIKHESLPPTSAAAAQHSLRVYHQVQTWRGKMVDATAWGWQIGDGILAPVETTKGVVPENLLKMVACGCKTQCRKSFGCRKLGLNCSSTCSHCAGKSCSNRLEDI